MLSSFIQRITTVSCRRPFLIAAPSMNTIRRTLIGYGRQRVGESIEVYERRIGKRDYVYYVLSGFTTFLGLSFMAVPFYRLFCEATSFGGLTQVATDLEAIEKMKKVSNRLIRVSFNADVPSSMQWSFKPLHPEIYVHPGETTLAFFTATNPTKRPIVGISSYNLLPFQAAYYFCKIQCFCFEEQILNPGEQVDLPVFFYIDPDFANDPALENLDNITLSYTFFEAKDGLVLPDPFAAPVTTTANKMSTTQRSLAIANEVAQPLIA